MAVSPNKAPDSETSAPPKNKGGAALGNKNSVGHGRPTIYTPELGELIIEKMAEGLSLLGAAAELNITRSRIYEWEKKHEEFAEALELARGKRIARLERDLSEQTDAVQARIGMFMLKNADPSYRDKLELDHQGAISGLNQPLPIVVFGGGDIKAVAAELDKDDADEETN